MTIATTTESGQHELVIRRVYNAPPELLFLAWTRVDYLMRWFGPRDFRISDTALELRPGGTWQSCMHAPDGKAYWSRGVFREIEAPRRLVMTFRWDAVPGEPQDPETLIRVTFTAVAEGTRMEFRQSGFASASSRDGHEGGWSEAFERLATAAAEVA